jgi:serine/threonine-protein kinase
MAATLVDREAFFQALAQSGLLSAKEVRAVCDKVPADAKVKSIARLLVEWGLLTRFQAEHLLVGRAYGFFIGPYKILEQIGAGGMGRVYKAMQQTMQRTVALKVLSPQLMQSAKVQKLFQREVQATAQLNHPNIVTAYDANQVDGRHYLAMEYVDGPNLDQLVRAQGRLPIGRACDLIRQAAFGLQHAHEQGMVHRDIKPANLLVQNGKRSAIVKILDFGLARLQEPSPIAPAANTILVKQNTVMGTPDFLSPEQSRDLHKVDIRSDLYSLGCTFYYLLTGQLPFPGGTSVDKLIRHASEEPPAIAALRPEVPAEVIAIVQRLIAKRPEDRFQTPQDLADALAPFAEPGPVPWAGERPAADKKTPVRGVPAAPPQTPAETLPQDPLLTPVSHELASAEATPPARPWLLWTAMALATAALATAALAGALVAFLNW